MKNLLFILLLTPFLLCAQTPSDPGLFEVIYLKVMKGKEKAFEAAVKSHNSVYHNDETPYGAGLMYNINGPYGGQYSWIMGPTTFTAMDDRPGEGAHNDDWENVGQYVESASSPSYWSEAPKLTSEGTSTGNGKSLVWIYDLKQGKSQRWEELVSQVKEVYDKKRPAESMYVYWNEFADTRAGHDVAVVFPFKKWAWLDRASTFAKDYEEVHGKNTWSYFLDEFADCINGRVDVLREAIR